MYASWPKAAWGVCQERSITCVNVEGREHDCSWSVQTTMGAGVCKSEHGFLASSSRSRFWSPSDRESVFKTAIFARARPHVGMCILVYVMDFSRFPSLSLHSLPVSLPEKTRKYKRFLQNY